MAKLGQKLLKFPCVSVGNRSYSQRSPRFRVSRALTFTSSWINAFRKKTRGLV